MRQQQFSHSHVNFEPERQTLEPSKTAELLVWPHPTTILDFHLHKQNEFMFGQKCAAPITPKTSSHSFNAHVGQPRAERFHSAHCFVLSLQLLGKLTFALGWMFSVMTWQAQPVEGLHDRPSL